MKIEIAIGDTPYREEYRGSFEYDSCRPYLVKDNYCSAEGDRIYLQPTDLSKPHDHMPYKEILWSWNKVQVVKYFNVEKKKYKRVIIQDELVKDIKNGIDALKQRVEEQRVEIEILRKDKV